MFCEKFVSDLFVTIESIFAPLIELEFTRAVSSVSVFKVAVYPVLLFVFTVTRTGNSEVCETEFITWFPFTDTAELSTEAESVGVYKANVLLLKTRLQKEINAKNTTRNFNSRLNHPPPREVPWLWFLALHIALFYHKKNRFLILKKNVVLPFWGHRPGQAPLSGPIKGMRHSSILSVSGTRYTAFSSSLSGPIKGMRHSSLLSVSGTRYAAFSPPWVCFQKINIFRLYWF